MSDNDKTPEQLHEQLCDLQTQLAYQDDHIQKLNDALYQQQKRLDALELMQKSLEQRLKTDRGNDHEPSLVEQVPPHY